MANIHDDAWRGTLTASRLPRYLNANPSIIDSPGGLKDGTPLASAAFHGHLDIVRLLLDNPHRLADPNAPSHNISPLFCATRSLSRDRCAIVRLLLDAGAYVDACDDEYNTPLMNAIVEIRDKDVVHALVDHGASLTARNRQGKTAEMLAREVGMEQELWPWDERNSSSAELINLIVALVIFFMAYTNSSVIKDVVRGTVRKLCGIGGAKDEEVAKETSEPRTAEEFTTSLDTYVADTGLQKFFTPNDPFLQTLARKAAALRNDPTTSLGTPENIKGLTRLSLYHPIIYCDDSGSMSEGNRYQNQRELVSRIASIATKLVPDDFGVELCFINSGSSANLSAAQINAAMDAVEPSGGTEIGTQLRRKILEPLVYSFLSNPSQRGQRPLLVCAITDGCPSGEDMACFKNEIVECRRALVKNGYEPNAVAFSISQIGNSSSATEFLDGLRGDPEIKDVLYRTTDQLDSKYQELRADDDRLEEWLLDMLTKPIMGKNEK